VTHVQAEIKVNIRYFAAARAAAGMEEEALAVLDGTSVTDLIERLSVRNPSLATVLARCSFLCDGIAVRNRAEPLRTNQTVDVLPPFAGG
jgi:molybdopterin converting factor small subunit